MTGFRFIKFLLLTMVAAAAMSGCDVSQASGPVSAMPGSNGTGGGFRSHVVPGVLQIWGRPRGIITVGELYEFRPEVRGVPSGEVTFSIIGKPAWANFDSATGLLIGTPDNEDVGESAGIVIHARSAGQRTAVGPFAIYVRPHKYTSRHNGWGSLPAR